MKEKIRDCFFVFLRIWGSAWLAFLVSVVPLYIWRGTQGGNEFGENLLLSIIGLFFGFLFLMLLQARDDLSHRYNIRQNLLLGGGAVGIYIISWVIAYFPSKNNYPIAVLGYHFSYVLGTGADERPTFLGSLVSALIFGLIYFLAILLGTKIARQRQARFWNSSKQDK